MISNKLFLTHLYVIAYLCYLTEAKHSDLEFGDTVINGHDKKLFLIKNEESFSKSGISTESNADCNCGNFSTGCEIQNNLKVCSCKTGYASGGYQMCVPMCNETSKCKNGGSCINNVCLCLPGTSGPFCDTIAGCGPLNCHNDKEANCSFNIKKLQPYCQCKQKNFVFDYDNKICKSCNCDECKDADCFYTSRKCEFIRGEKVCTCLVPNYEYNPKTQTCEYCNCGGRAKACEFDQEGKRKCICPYGYEQNEDKCETCDCPLGACTFKNKRKTCICGRGYSPFKGGCKACDCGDFGTCEFNSDGKKVKCNCKEGYEEHEGRCVDIQSCYCGENSNCTMILKRKMCECSPGFHEESGICLDINECRNSSVCPPHEKCINTIGGYRCECKDGFRVSSLDDVMLCEDINECLNNSACPHSDTTCVNTIGSYRCICKTGYFLRSGAEGAKITCQNNSSWKLGYGFFIGIFAAIIIGMLIVIYIKSRS